VNEVRKNDFYTSIKDILQTAKDTVYKYVNIFDDLEKVEEELKAEIERDVLELGLRE